MPRELPATRWLALAALGWALLVLSLGLVLVARDGVGSGVLIWTLPPIVVAACGTTALFAGTRSGYQAPLVVALIVAIVAAAAAMVSFIAPLVLTVGPVCGLLLVATLTELAAPRVAPSATPVVRAPD